MKGFKKDGKFIPTENRKKSALTIGSIKFKKPLSFTEEEYKKLRLGRDIPEQKITDVVGFDQLDEDAKEKAREWIRTWIYDDMYYAEDEGILFDNDAQELNPKHGDVNHEIFNGVMPKHWDADRGAFIQFEGLEVKDDEAFRKWLGISKPAWKKLDYKFENDSSGMNTTLEIFDAEYYNESGANISTLTVKQQDEVNDAISTFERLMDNALSNLRENIEYTGSDENVDEMIITNEYTFDRHGNRMNS